MSLFVSETDKNKLSNIGENVTGLLAKFDNNIVKEALDFVESGTISEQLGELSDDDRNEIKDFFLKLINMAGGDEVVEMLSKTVGDIPAEGFDWSWSDDLSKDVPLSGSVTLTLGASAAAEAKIGSQQPSYYFKGEAGVSGSVTVPFSYGAFTVRGGAKGSATLEAKFEHNPATRVLTALAKDLPTLAQLTDSEQLLESEEFKSATLNLEGEVNLGASVSAGRSWVAALGTRENAPAVDVKLGAQYDIDWAHNGQFEVAIARIDSSRRLDITLTQVNKETLKRALSVGANVKFSNVSNALQPVMDQFEDLPGPLRDITQKYSQPSEIVREFLESQISSTDERIQKIAETIFGDKSADGLVNDIVTEAVEFVDGQVDHWTTLAIGEVESLTPSILDRLNVPTGVRGDLESFLNEKLSEASDDLGKKIISTLKEALQKAVRTNSAGTDVDVGTEIVSFLKALKIQATDASDDLDQWAIDLLKPVNELLAKYRVFERKLVDAVEVVEKNALIMQFTREVIKRGEDTTLLKFTLDLTEDQAKAEEAYRRMLLGDFRQTMRDGQDPSLAYITLKDGYFKSVFERETTQGLNINFFGMEMSLQHVLSNSLTVQNSIGGDIQIFEAKGAVKDRWSGFGEKEETWISSALSLVGPDSTADTRGLSVGLLYDDDNVAPHEMRGYLESFAGMGLLTKGSADYFSDEKSNIGIKDDNGKRALRMQAQMSFTRSEIKDMARVHVDTIKNTAIRAQLEAMYQVPTLRDTLNDLSGPSFQFDPSNPEHYSLFTEPISDLRSQLQKLGITLSRGSIAPDLIPYVRRNSEDIVTFLECWQTLVNKPLPSIGEDGKLKASEVAEFEEKNAEMIKALDQWAGVASIKNALREAYVSPMALAFLKVLKTLSGREDTKLPIVISWNQDNRVRRIAVI